MALVLDKEKNVSTDLLFHIEGHCSVSLEGNKTTGKPIHKNVRKTRDYGKLPIIGGNRDIQSLYLLVMYVIVSMDSLCAT